MILGVVVHVLFLSILSFAHRVSNGLPRNANEIPRKVAIGSKRPISQEIFHLLSGNITIRPVHNYAVAPHSLAHNWVCPGIYLQEEKAVEAKVSADPSNTRPRRLTSGRFLDHTGDSAQ